MFTEILAVYYYKAVCILIKQLAVVLGSYQQQGSIRCLVGQGKKLMDIGFTVSRADDGRIRVCFAATVAP